MLAAEPFKRTSCNHQLPNGDRIINMLPTLPGEELTRLGYDAALATCQSLVRRHWAWLRQGSGEWREYRFAGTASLLGIREGRRIVGEYVLTAIRLDNGNTLVAGGGELLVTEVDANANVGWQLRPADVPEVQMKWIAGLQRLPDGNTVVCNWLGHGQYGKGVPVFEVTPDKELVWCFRDSQTTKSVSSVCLLGQASPVR